MNILKHLPPQVHFRFKDIQLGIPNMLKLRNLNVSLGGVAERQRVRLQSEYTWVRLPPPPPTNLLLGLKWKDRSAGNLFLLPFSTAVLTISIRIICLFLGVILQDQQLFLLYRLLSRIR